MDLETGKSNGYVIANGQSQNSWWQRFGKFNTKLYLTARDEIIEDLLDNSFTNSGTTMTSINGYKVLNFKGSESIDFTFNQNIRGFGMWLYGRKATYILGNGGSYLARFNSPTQIISNSVFNIYVDGVDTQTVSLNKWYFVYFDYTNDYSIDSLQVGRYSTNYYDGFINDLFFVNKRPEPLIDFLTQYRCATKKYYNL